MHTPVVKKRFFRKKKHVHTRTKKKRRMEAHERPESLCLSVWKSRRRGTDRHTRQRAKERQIVRGRETDRDRQTHDITSSKTDTKTDKDLKQNVQRRRGESTEINCQSKLMSHCSPWCNEARAISREWKAWSRLFWTQVSAGETARIPKHSLSRGRHSPRWWQSVTQVCQCPWYVQRTREKRQQHDMLQANVEQLSC